MAVEKCSLDYLLRRGTIPSWRVSTNLIGSDEPPDELTETDEVETFEFFGRLPGVV